MTLLRTIVLIAATLATGLSAGLLFAFAHCIMPGLARTDDRTFVGAFQAVDRAISNPWFAASFLGAPVLTALGIVLHLPAEVRPVLPWLVAALVLYGVMLAITFRVNLPLNEAIKAAGDPDRIDDLAAVRGRFEAPWVRWNGIRTVPAVAALGCLGGALFVLGQQ